MKHKKRYLVISGISFLLLGSLLLWSWLFSSLLKGRLTLEAGSYSLAEEDFLRMGVSNLNYRLLTDLSTIDTHVPGEYAVQFLVNGETRVCILRIQDTVPPQATIRSYAIPVGEDCTGDDFVVSLTDESAVEAQILGLSQAPSSLPCGTYAVTIRLTDAGNNRAEYTSELTVCNVRAARRAEFGVRKFSAGKYRLAEGDELAWEEDITPLLEKTGIYHPTLLVNGIPVTVRLTVKDTTPPDISAPPLSLWAGQTATAADFVTSCEDASQVRFSFQEKPDFSQLGEQAVTILAEDADGNQTEVRTALTIREDDEPPVITGAKDLSFPLGVTITYRKNVFAVDGKDGQVALRIDSSQANPGKEGTYPVTYSAADELGNTSSITVKLTITEPLSITEDEVYALADEVLEELGIQVGGADGAGEPASPQAYDTLYAIYQWCKNTISYSGTSDKSSYLKAAYDGLSTHSGDCYTYSCTADLLMARAGFSCVEISRSGTDTFHTWNLVQYGNAWYHFDSCPLLAGESFEPFLVTDEELLTFSDGYGRRHPDKSHQAYYQFNPSLYPERAQEALGHP